MTAGLKILESPLLADQPGVSHGFFTRHGGVSRGLYDSLNIGSGSGDEAGAVVENRRRVAAAFDVEASALTTCFQVHSSRVSVTPSPWGHERPRSDGVVTTRHGVLCGALSADCAPVLIADGRAGVVAAIHAGWRGALEGVVGAAVSAMIEQGATAHRMVACVGPCIGRDSYEVGADFLAQFVSRDPAYERFFSPGAAADKRQFDLPRFVLARLAAAGVGSSEWIGRDTCAEEDDFFSYRRAFRRGEPDYGRSLSVIAIDRPASV